MAHMEYISTNISQFTKEVTYIYRTEETMEIHINVNVIVVFQWILLTVVCQIISIFGVGSNIINIICFIKQGLTDSVNISLLGLAISDLGCLVTLIWSNICFTPAMITADLPFAPIELQYLTSGMPHATFSRITSWITALITLERCLCITSPLKVKSIVTPKRMAIIVTGVYLVLISSVAPLYVVNSLGMKYYPQRNISIIGIIHAKNSEEVETVSLSVNNIFIPFGAFLVIIICTLILVRKLQSNTKWRKTAATSSQTENVTKRNQKVAKMVVMISTLFIFCLVPLSFYFIATIVEPELSLYGKYKEIVTIIAMLVIFLESLNSSLNIFIYYRMSSRYREICMQLLGIGK